MEPLRTHDHALTPPVHVHETHAVRHLELLHRRDSRLSIGHTPATLPRTSLLPPPPLRRPSLAPPHPYLLSCRSRCILFRQFLCHASHWTPRLPRSLARCLFSQRSQIRSAPAFRSRTTVDYPAITDSSCITVTPCRLATSSFWINKTNASPLLTPASLPPRPLAHHLSHGIQISSPPHLPPTPPAGASTCSHAFWFPGSRTTLEAVALRTADPRPQPGHRIPSESGIDASRAAPCAHPQLPDLVTA